MIYQWLIQVSHIVCSFNIFLSSSVTSEPEKRANFLSGIINSRELLFFVPLSVRQGWSSHSEDNRKQANLLFCRLHIFGSLANQKLGQQQKLWSFSVTPPDVSTGNFNKTPKVSLKLNFKPYNTHEYAWRHFRNNCLKMYPEIRVHYSVSWEFKFPILKERFIQDKVTPYFLGWHNGPGI